MTWPPPPVGEPGHSRGAGGQFVVGLLQEAGHRQEILAAQRLGVLPLAGLVFVGALGGDGEEVPVTTVLAFGDGLPAGDLEDAGLEVPLGVPIANGQKTSILDSLKPCGVVVKSSCAMLHPAQSGTSRTD